MDRVAGDGGPGPGPLEAFTKFGGRGAGAGGVCGCTAALCAP